MDSIISKVRNLIGDNYTYSSDIFNYLTSKIFTLSEANIDATTLVVYRNGVLYASSNYSYNSNTGKVTVTGALVAGDVLEFNYNAYEKYSNNEIIGYIKASLTYLSTEKYQVFVAKSDNEVFPTPTEAEENLMALIASILMTGGIKDYKTPEINIAFTNNEDISEQITRIIRQFRKTFGTVKFIKTDRDVKIDKEDE